jgi:predicted dehydrogenase
MINIGIIGCGYWGVNYIRVFNELVDSQVAKACDTKAERLDFVQQRYPTVEVTSEAGDLLEDPEIDAVVVSTSADSHFALAEKGLLKGKHLLVEKPLTTTVKEGEKLVNLAEKMSKVVMVGHTFLYNAGIRKMKECIQAEDFGRMYYLHSTRTNLGPIRNDVNAIWDLAPHDVSIFDYLLEAQPLWVSAVGSRLLGNSKEDVGFITLAYPGNVIGNIHVSWADPNKVREVVAVGSGKRIVFDDLNNLERVRIFEKGVSPSTVEADSFGEFRFLVRDGDIISPKIEPSEPLKNQCSHFLDCIKKSMRPLTDGQNGLDVVGVMEAVQESLRKRGTPVEIRKAGREE